MNIKKIGTNILAFSIGAIGIVSSLVTSFWPAEKIISIMVLNGVIFFGLLIIMIILQMWSEVYQKNSELENKIIDLEEENQRIKNNSSYEVPFNCFNPRGNNTEILLIKNNANFRNGTFVSIYNKTDSSEDLAYLGQILNIQTDNCYQVQVIKANIGYEDFEININTIKNFIVHPSIPSNFIGLLKND
jgi:hypothetical protein